MVHSHSKITLVALALSVGWTISPALGQSAVQTGSETTQNETQATLSPLSQAIKDAIATLPRKTSAQRKRAKELAKWYEARDYTPVWTDEERAADTIYRLLKSYEDGLIPSDYDAPRLLNMAAALEDDGRGKFEVALSAATVLYAQHLFSGRVTPSSINRELVIYPDRISVERVLDRLSTSAEPAKTLANMAPETPRYDRLRSHLLALRIRKAKGGYTPIPKAKSLKPGMTDSRLDALRKRLVEAGDLKAATHSGDIYDGALVTAVKRFQERHGLAQDGVVGPGTLKQLNIDIDQRIAQVELNLERRRWMQNDYGRRYIFVNLADQVLKLVDNEKTIHAEIVQVGLPYHRTPVFSDAMSYVEFNPFWNVPYSIATKEYLPRLKRNPYALNSGNFKVLRGGRVVSPSSVNWSAYSRRNFPVRLRQDPGPKNALGRVKFMFPNKHNVYIHDTPSKSKFNRSSRYFSHGCVRLKNPFKFAEKLLAFQNMSKGRISGIRRSKKRTVVRLKNKVPVHITYLTAWVNKDGSVHYRPDVYGRDKILAKALKRKI